MWPNVQIGQLRPFPTNFSRATLKTKSLCTKRLMGRSTTNSEAMNSGLVMYIRADKTLLFIESSSLVRNKQLGSVFAKDGNTEVHRPIRQLFRKAFWKPELAMGVVSFSKSVATRFGHDTRAMEQITLFSPDSTLAGRWFRRSSLSLQIFEDVRMSRR